MDANNITKKYDNGEITVVWKPAMCIHSKICWQATGLPEVFNPREKPWVKINGSTTERIIEQVNKCPSAALSFYFTNAETLTPEPATIQTKVEAILNGPLMVYGTIAVKDQYGNETTKEKTTAFCRCGLSGNKPYCDGSHKATLFDEK